MRRPFEASAQELTANLDPFVDAICADLQSDFLVMPRGTGFVEYERFQEAYQVLKQATAGFHTVTPENVWQALTTDSLALLVLRTILGMSAPEWASLAATETGVPVDQGTARRLDRGCRLRPDYIARLGSSRSQATLNRLRALVEVACRYLVEPVPPGAEDTVHRLKKVDTAEGLVSLRHAAEFHIPYAVLLYERYLGRPFASHRDAVSELVGEVMESAIEHRLRTAGIVPRKTGRAERIPGFDQAPDFIVPDEYAPQVVIEAKMTSDDGTARDKITRIIHLAELNRERIASGKRGFEVVACIDGRGFGVRREDMRRLLLSVNGKVFTLKTLDRLIPCTGLSRFVITPPESADA